MSRIQAMLTRFTRDEGGSSAVEYALIAALLALILIGTASTVGGNLGTTFTGVADMFSNGIAAQPTTTAPGVVACRGTVTGQCRQERHCPGITG